MDQSLHDLTRHNAWATAEILTYCQELDEAMLQTTVPGTFGTISATLQHLINAEASYLFRLTGAGRSAIPWDADAAAGLAVLAERATLLATTWEQFLAGDVDSERRAEARGDDDEAYTVAAGALLTQALHHANEHRAHICTILGAHGYEPPELSGWAYALAVGRMTLATGTGDNTTS